VKAEIVAIGSELLTPFRQDTNSLYLTEKLNALGVDVAFKTIVGDNPRHLTSVAEIALGRAEVVIFMGGLGPTEDDLTRESVAAALGVELRRDAELLKSLEQRFASRKITMTPNNAQQADVIEGAVILPNPIGSAVGQWISGKFDGQERVIILLPGPPHELKKMFEEQCFERLRDKLPPSFIATRVLKLAMIGESQADARVAPIYKRHPEVQTTILAGAGEIQLHLKAQADSLDVAQERVDTLSELLEVEMGDYVFASQDETMEQIVGYYLQMRNATIAVAESCTGGLIGERITSVSGSSRYFAGGAIVYSNEMKSELAGVPREMIQSHGAVSKEVAIALAEGIRKKCSATLGVGVTGIAGPMGGSPEKPVGLVFHALASETGTDVIEKIYPGDRKRIRYFASQQALDMVRRKLI
jgi:nicotinamide-nucleotide amidase